MSDDGRVQVNHEVPKKYRERAQRNTEHGEMSELVREVYKRAADPNGVDDREDINDRLRELRRERDGLQFERRRTVEKLDSEIDKKETHIARLEERKEKTRSRADKFEGALDQLVSHVENGGRIWRSYPGVERAAETVGEPPEYVIREVRKRAPDVPNDRFEQGDSHGGLR